MFLTGIAGGFLFVMIFITLFVFTSKPAPNVAPVVFNKPKVSIDMSVFESEQFKNLQAFSVMDIQFKYSAFTQEKEPKNGFILASSKDHAREMLEAMGLQSISVQEAHIGRDNPFEPYYLNEEF